MVVSPDIQMFGGDEDESMAYCPRCKGTMSLKQTICPSCGYDFPPELSSPRRYPGWASLVTGVILAGVGVASLLEQPPLRELIIPMLFIGGGLAQVALVVAQGVPGWSGQFLDRAEPALELAALLPVWVVCLIILAFGQWGWGHLVLLLVVSIAGVLALIRLCKYRRRRARSLPAAEEGAEQDGV
jgi:hypothetical protein